MLSERIEEVRREERSHCAFGCGSGNGARCGAAGTVVFGSLLLCEEHARMAERHAYREDWEESVIYLGLWKKVAVARENNLLTRLLEEARIEAEAERERALRALETEIKAGKVPASRRRETDPQYPA
jgi:hypothetical protein